MLLIVFVTIIFVSFLFVEIIKGFYLRFNFSKNFIGFTILAIGTSFPEFVNAIMAGLISDKKYQINSFYNVTGSNVMQLVFLSLVAVCLSISFLKKNKKNQYFLITSSFLKNQVFLWFLSFVATIFLILLFLFRDFFQKIEFKSINFFSFFFIIIWFFYLFFSFNEKKEKTLDINSKDLWFSSLNKNLFLLTGCLIWITFSCLSLINFFLISKSTEQFNIPKHIGFGMALSFITSIPEFSAFFFLFKKKMYGMLSVGFLGSSLFNLTLPTITSLIKNKWVFNELVENDKSKIFIWLLSSALINLFFFCGFYKIKENKLFTSVFFSFLTIFIYIFGILWIAFI